MVSDKFEEVEENEGLGIQNLEADTILGACDPTLPIAVSVRSNKVKAFKPNKMFSMISGDTVLMLKDKI